MTMGDSEASFRGLEDQEESVRIAVKALGTMRNGAARSESARTISSTSTSPPFYSPSSAPKSPSLPSPSSSQSRESSIDPSSSSPGLVSRMSHLPLVGSALWAYEQGKASSRVVKYGAEMMESSVKTISRPVIDRLPVNVNQLDEFACRQLDRLDRYRRPSASAGDNPSSPPSMSTSPDLLTPDRDRGRPTLRTKTLDGSALDDRDESMPPEPLASGSRTSRRDGGERFVPSWLEATSPFVAPPPPPPDARSSTPTQELRLQPSPGSEQQQVAQRSRWQAVLLEAGGLSAALSEDSMRRLKYCLQWLQYATAHIDAQILILRDFTANLQPLPSDSLSANRRPPISEEHMRKLTDVRRDIVHTIRQVVDVVSKYAGGALPEPARNRVRGFILKLPQRWATKAGPGPSSAVVVGNVAGERETIAAAGSGTGAVRRPGGQRRAAHRERGAGAESSLKSGQSSRAPSPSSSPRLARPSVTSQVELSNAVAVSNGSALVAAQKILVLATESLDMMRNVTGVVKDSLDRADAWVGRLRTVGIQRGAQEGEDTEEGGSEFEFSSERLRHRRTGSSASHSVFGDDAPDSMPSPFFSGSSSTTTTNWGSSIPSTPGGSYTASGSSYVSAPSPSAISMIPIGQMSLGGSSYNTPRSVLVGLPDDDVGEEREVPVVVGEESAMALGEESKLFERSGVRVAGVDGVHEMENEEKKMDVDG